MYLICIIIKQKRERKENTTKFGGDSSVFSPSFATCNNRGPCCATDCTIQLPADYREEKPMQNLFMLLSTELITFHSNGYYLKEK